MKRSVRLMSIATAVPPFEILQGDVAMAADRAFAGRYGDFERLSRVFETSGIRRRFAVRPLDWYFTDLGWPERAGAYLAGASDLFVEVANDALHRAGLLASDIDCVVTVSSTGIVTPSLEARVAGRMGFRSDVERVPVFGLGCAGGVSGLAIASRLAAAQPGSKVLLVALELCSLAFRLDTLTKANIVATALFADGAAACILQSDLATPGLAEVEMSGQHLWPDTVDIMGWSIDREGLGVIFDRAIPPFAEAEMQPAVTAILARNGLKATDIDRFAFHPGGRKVVNALERAFALGQGTLDHERAILADFGNMSAPTALFVLEKLIDKGLPPRTLLTAMGPGFTASCVSLRRAA